MPFATWNVEFFGMKNGFIIQPAGAHESDGAGKMEGQALGRGAELVRHPLGFLQLSQPPSEDEVESFYSKRYYEEEKGNYRHSYSSQELEIDKKKLNRQLNQCLELRGSTDPGGFLDVGCGEGWALAELDSRGWAVTGLDFSDSGVARMNPLLKDKVQRGDIFESIRMLREKGRKFDVVWLDHVLEHVLKPVELLAMLVDVVAEGGILMVSVPNDGNAYHEKLVMDGTISRRWWISPPDHLSYFVKQTLLNVLGATGWQVSAISSSFPIDWFLSNQHSNYVDVPERGEAAHEASLLLEGVIENNPIDLVDRFYAALADIGLGREVLAYAKKKNGVFS